MRTRLVGLVLSWVSMLSRANLLSIDFGSQFFKAYIARKGKIEAVLNLETKRKTPNVVSFREVVRQFGDSALSLQARDPKTTLLFFRYLLGMNLTGVADVSPGKVGLHEKYYPFEIFADQKRKVPAFKVKDQEMVIEEVAAHVLGFAKSLAEAAAEGTEVTEVMLTVPASATTRQRQALKDAAEIAGFKGISLVHESTSAAVDLALKIKWEKDSPKKPLNTILFNMGSQHTEISVVSFEPAETMGRLTSFVKVLASKTIENLGGQQVDILLADKMLAAFKEKNPALCSIDGSVRAMKKLVIQGQATKTFLSGYGEAPVNVEMLYEDTDFSMKMKRDDLEDAAAENFAKIGAAIDEVVALSGIQGGLAAIDNVEVTGGSHRIPKVQELLLEKVNANREVKLALGKRLDAEEAMAEGAAFILANRSAGFRARPIFLNDISVLEHTIAFTGLDPKTKEAKEYNKIFTIFPRQSSLNTVKTIHLQVDFNLQMNLLENGNLVTTYKIKGFGEDTVNKYVKVWKSKPHVAIQVGLDSCGMFKVQSASAVWEELSAEPTKPPAANDTSAKPKLLKVKRVPLEVLSVEHLPLPMSTEDKKVALQRYHDAQAFDANVKATEDAKNTLESYMYEVKNTMDTEMSKQVWAKEEARAEITSLCSTLQTWLYDDGANADKATYEEKFAQLEQKVGAEPAQRLLEAYISEVCQAIGKVADANKKAEAEAAMTPAPATLPPQPATNASQPPKPTVPPMPTKPPKPAFNEEARVEIEKLCVMIQEWLKVDGASASRGAYAERYKQLEQKISPFQESQELKRRKISEAAAAQAKWAGPWAAEACQAAERTKDWAAAVVAKVASSNATASAAEAQAPPAAPGALWSAQTSIGVISIPAAFLIAAALIGFLTSSRSSCTVLRIHHSFLIASEEPLLTSCT
eukprot:gnl/MRDRNA2_/MRDRNA2_76456_c0_seq2.p1 gnl/MRDRNA2_/MRDRNA2_76456_c0~~gnl/MRDRNA2_/MRDRNA2_76456_c0_seq2.p1  ORF type:complete len:921 (-),score=231.69 gnl/MRDRNA2_/MRDRNA2_76456_c0_seq2:94-2856(-)